MEEKKITEKETELKWNSLNPELKTKIKKKLLIIFHEINEKRYLLRLALAFRKWKEKCIFPVKENNNNTKKKTKKIKKKRAIKKTDDSEKKEKIEDENKNNDKDVNNNNDVKGDNNIENNIERKEGEIENKAKKKFKKRKPKPKKEQISNNDNKNENANIITESTLAETINKDTEKDQDVKMKTSEEKRTITDVNIDNNSNYINTHLIKKDTGPNPKKIIINIRKKQQVKKRSNTNENKNKALNNLKKEKNKIKIL